MEQDEAAMNEVETDRVCDLVEALREKEGDSVRMIFRYEGEEYEVAHLREDVDEQYTDAELRERIKTLMMKGLSDPPREQALYDLGSLQATMRWFEDATCAYFPDTEWSGVIVVLDRTESPLVDLALSHLES